MKFFFLIAFTVLLTGAGCSKQTSYPELTSPPSGSGAETAEMNTKAAGKLLGQMIFDSVAYAIEPADMLQPFIQEFGDGTVIDKAIIHRVRESKNSKPSYYLVGMGQKNGSFRMMAFELYATSDNSLYISSDSRRYKVSTDGCEFCMFSFNDNQITGSYCESGSSSTLCKLETSNGNNFMKKN